MELTQPKLGFPVSWFAYQEDFPVAAYCGSEH
jgi:hypothetical protein